jgi:hypothetical protein
LSSKDPRQQPTVAEFFGPELYKQRQHIRQWRINRQIGNSGMNRFKLFC